MRINVKFEDGSTKCLVNPSGQKIASVVRGADGKSGYCEVVYTREYRNSFVFVDKKDFKEKLLPCIETALIEEFSVGKDK